MDDNEIKSQGEESDDDVGELMEIVLNTREQGEMIEKLIKNQIEVKDDLISKLHNELEYYKQDAASRYVDQVMKAIIKVHKDMNKMVTSAAWNNMNLEDVKREYLYIRDDITDLLEQQNVDSFHSEQGDVFDATIHQAKIEPTTDKQLDKTVKASVSDGYRKGDKVLIPERVIIYQYKA